MRSTIKFVLGSDSCEDTLLVCLPKHPKYGTVQKKSKHQLDYQQNNARAMVLSKAFWKRYIDPRVLSASGTYNVYLDG